jgi:EpsI family protein
MRASRFILALLILSGAVAANRHFDYLTARAAVSSESSRKEFAEFPGSVGKWRFDSTRLTPRELELLNVDDYLFGDFVASDGGRIKVYVGYYNNPDKATRHPPTICYPGGGHLKTYEAYSVLTVPGVRGGLDVNVTAFEKDGLRQLVLYWYSISGYTGANPSWQKLVRLRSILSGRAVTGASKIQIATDVETTQEAAVEKVEEFLADFLPVLADFIPRDSADGS